MADFGALDGVTVLTARWIVGFDNGHHILIPSGEVAVEGQRIIFVGKRAPMAAARRFDFGDALIGPGFIDLNALSDLDTTVLSFDNQPEERTGRVWPRDYYEAGPVEMYSPEELAFQKRYAFAQLLRNGITTAAPIASLFYREWAETVAEFEAAAQSAFGLGIRVYLGPAYAAGHAVYEPDGTTSMQFSEERANQGLDDAIAFVRKWDGAFDGLVRGMLAPNRIETCTPDLLAKTAAAMKDLDCVVRLHACQSDFEVQAVKAMHGKGAIEWLDDVGLLGPKLWIPHFSHLTPGREDEDFQRVASAGVSVIHCPIVAARYGGSLDSLGKYLRGGLNVAMGTDTFPPDMIKNMQTALLFGRANEHDALAVRASDVYNAATLGGARALGRSDLGRLAEGAMADITVFQLAEPDHGQLIDPIQTMMIAGNSRAFSHVMVDGRFSVIDGVVQGYDAKAEGALAQAQFDRLLAQYPRRTPRHPPVGAIFASSFPVTGADGKKAPWHTLG